MHIGTQGLCDYEAPGSTKVKRTRRERASVSERERERERQCARDMYTHM